MVLRSLDDRELTARVGEYWDWIAVALFLLTTVDLLTTLLAAAAVGVAYEGNPLVRWLLRRSLPALVAVNLLAVAAGAVGFRAVVATLRRTPPRIRPYYALVVEVWLGLLVAAGLSVFANNVSVILLGRSLL
ncbi:hypothetical protein [Halobaculum sp. MBLA0143]|uniref:hypothetical protein n=1 Tax=Halobaculum sp. MBLA0143 TaxID=3079933 RepID=UPI0035264531